PGLFCCRHGRLNIIGQYYALGEIAPKTSFHFTVGGIGAVNYERIQSTSSFRPSIGFYLWRYSTCEFYSQKLMSESVSQVDGTLTVTSER
ncbi:MAG: hypothetical protein MJA29_14160, partial [Candidatus Omnitrophica bacterium]|nr:hypothetical protein [Candidatus Omnitrophota bacterium]